MRPSTLLLTPLAATLAAAADWMEVNVFCTTSSCSYLDGRWHSAFGTFFVDGRGGCQDPEYVPGLNNLCIDWSRNRAHFYFDNQGKRCLEMQEWTRDDSCTGNTACYRAVWNEVSCTW